MKQRLYTLATALFAGMCVLTPTAFADDDAAVALPDNLASAVIVSGTSYGWGLYGNGSDELTDSQYLYPASYFSDFTTDIDIYTYTIDLWPWQTLPKYENVKIWMANTDKTDGYTSTDETTLVPQEDLVLVYDGPWEAINTADEAGVVTPKTFVLDTPFRLEKGKGLAIDILLDVENGNPHPYLFSQNTELKCHAYKYTYKQSDDWTIYNTDNSSDYMYARAETANLTIGYTAAAAPEKLDISVAAGEWPTEATAGDEVTFPVVVTNEGTVDVESYTIELLDYSNDAENPEVLAQNEVTRYLAAESTFNGKVVYTFPKAGEYKLGVRVVAEGDENAENDVTEPVAFSVAANLPADLASAVIVSGTSYGYGLYGNGSDELTDSQYLYPASYFSDFTGDIDIYTYTIDLWPWQTLPKYENVKIWMANTDKTDGYTRNDVSTLVPQEDLVLVYDGPWEAMTTADEAGVVTPKTFVLDTPFTLEKGKGLAIDILLDVEDGNPHPFLFSQNTEEKYHAYKFTYTQSDDWSIYSDDDNTLSVAKELANLTIGYTAAPVKDVVDLSVAAGEEWPTEAFTDEELTFPVVVTNEGTVDVESYTIELLDYSNDAENPEVLAQNEVTRYLAAESTFNGKVVYTFAAAGEYKLGARVVAEGDEVAENNVTEPVNVSIKKESGVNALLDESDNVVIYNLQGIRVNKRSDLSAGVYIINGKKVTVK